jgi:oligopeptidase A
MENPLLIEHELPPFSALKNEHIEPAIKQIIAENEQVLDALLAVEPDVADWNSLIQVLDNLEDRLTSVWTTVSHLFGVSNSNELREIYDTCLPLITEYSTKLAQNKSLFDRINTLASRSDELGLSDSQKKVLDDYILDFRLSGVNLEPDEQVEFKNIEKRLNKLASEFSNNVLDATRAWSKFVEDKQELAGLPDVALATAAETARQRDLEGYVLTLDFPCYIAVLTYADNEALREEIYTASVTKASNQNKDSIEWNNEEVIDEILRLRNQKSAILGYKSFTELSLAKKMAEAPADVLGFLNDLVAKGRPVAEKEFEALVSFAASEGKPDLHAWDIPYYGEKLRKAQFNISQEELRPYFPVNKVKQGMFEIVEKLYGIRTELNESYDTWHPSVEAYDVYSGDTLIARFFLDLFTRENKRSGAWMDNCKSRRRLSDNTIQIPAAYLVCNFSEATSELPSLLTHLEVTTLFHEFGHGLHHILTAESELRVSGINGVAWDAVELPSQLMENWCWDENAIGLISSHYETGEALPKEILDRMLEARNFQAGMQMMRQLEFALFDFNLHNELEKLGPGYVRDIMLQARGKTAVFQTPDFNRFENSFSHIFAGGYAAGYYSYYWAEVLSADVFSKFTDAGVTDPAIGKEFLSKLLSRGGAVKALNLFKDFMGREPQIGAFLEQKGIPAG